jgi:hypothetical protein
MVEQLKIGVDKYFKKKVLPFVFVFLSFDERQTVF